MAITRITNGVIKPNENYDTHNIVSTGIITSVGADINGNPAAVQADIVALAIALG